jgi:hypothetical protein
MPLLEKKNTRDLKILPEELLAFAWPLGSVNGYTCGDIPGVNVEMESSA